MSKFARIQSVINGILMILLSLCMMLAPVESYALTLFILTVMLFVGAVRTLWFYFTSAIHMVDGKMILFRGMLLLDFSIFFYTLQDVPARFVIIYLIVVNAFMALVDLLRAREAKKVGASSWKLHLCEGILIIAVILGCQFMRDSVKTVVFIFSIGFFLSGCMRIAAGFRKTDIIFIH